MKLIINLILLLNTSFGAQIIIEHDNNYLIHAKNIERKFINDYFIPKSLISTKLVYKCSSKKKRNTLLICIRNEKGPEFLSDPSTIKSLISFGDL